MSVWTLSEKLSGKWKKAHLARRTKPEKKTIFENHNLELVNAMTQKNCSWRKCHLHHIIIFTFAFCLILFRVATDCAGMRKKAFHFRILYRLSAYFRCNEFIALVVIVIAARAKLIRHKIIDKKVCRHKWKYGTCQ